VSELARNYGLEVVTEPALERRGRGRFKGEVDAQYQRQFGNGEGLHVYFVETYTRDGEWDSENVVQLLDDFYVWASCTCDWYQRHFKRWTTCCHIYASVMKHRKRHNRRSIAKAA